MESLWEECLKVDISKTESAKVFILNGHVSHVEKLHVLKHGTSSTAMWSVITCFTFWLETHEP